MSNTSITNNLAVTNAIASIINSAFETGISPEWFQVESLNQYGFLDAAFACGTPMGGELSGGMATPSGKPARNDWAIRARLNADWVEDDEEADSPWTIVTAASAFENWQKYSADQNKPVYCREVVNGYLRYLEAIAAADYKLAEEIFDNTQPDGVSDDTMAQIAISGDSIYG
jgi:hypothetical protein